MRRRTLAAGIGAALVVLGWAVASGCAGADDDPEPEPSLDAGPDADVDGGAGGGAPIRTVEIRHPFGNVAKATTLLWDGDFEWTYPFADQYGWLIGGGGGMSYGNPDTVIGARCASGLKCAELQAGRFLVGLGVASKGHSLAVSFAAKPHAGCGGVIGVLMTEYAGAEQLEISPTTSLPDETGWCRYQAVASERDRAQWLYIENQSGEPALIDDAVIERVDPRAHHRKRSTFTPERVAYFARVRAQIRDAIKPGDPPPNPDRLIFEQNMKRLRLGRARTKR